MCSSEHRWFQNKVPVPTNFDWPTAHAHTRQFLNKRNAFHASLRPFGHLVMVRMPGCSRKCLKYTSKASQLNKQNNHPTSIYILQSKSTGSISKLIRSWKLSASAPCTLTGYGVGESHRLHVESLSELPGAANDHSLNSWKILRPHKRESKRKGQKNGTSRSSTCSAVACGNICGKMLFKKSKNVNVS